MRWVIKIGSAVLSKPEGGLDRAAVQRIAGQAIQLHKDGHDILIVSSGAVAAGVGRLGWTDRPSDLRLKQSAAAVGQLALMEAYEEFLWASKITPAQILLTRDDLLNRERYLNIRNTLMNLLSLRTIPVINENDTVSTEEIQFGDNDTLSAVVASKVGADRLVLLSDVPGVYDFDQDQNQSERRIISVIDRVTPEMEKKASKIIGTKLSVGGMAAKLKAAKMAAAAGIETWIASGYGTDVLARINTGQAEAGTRFSPKKNKFASRQSWIAFGKVAKGFIVVDEGAAKALLDHKKSLLPKGIKSVRGKFSLGDTIQIKSAKGVELGRGLSNFSSDDVKKIKGHHSSDVAKLLGRAGATEVVHRDNLVLF